MLVVTASHAVLAPIHTCIAPPPPLLQRPEVPKFLELMQIRLKTESLAARERSVGIIAFPASGHAVSMSNTIPAGLFAMWRLRVVVEIREQVLRLLVIDILAKGVELVILHGEHPDQCLQV